MPTPRPERGPAVSGKEIEHGIGPLLLPLVGDVDILGLRNAQAINLEGVVNNLFGNTQFKAR